MSDGITVYEIRPREDGQYEIDRDQSPLGLVESIRDAHEFIAQDRDVEDIRGKVRVDLSTYA